MPSTWFYPFAIDIDIPFKKGGPNIIRNNPDAQRSVASKTECQITESCFREADVLRVEAPLVTRRRRFTQIDAKSTEQPAENPPPVLRIQALDIKAMVVNHLLLLST